MHTTLHENDSQHTADAPMQTAMQTATPSNPEFFAPFNYAAMQAFLTRALTHDTAGRFFSKGVELSGHEQLETIQHEQLLFFGNHTSHIDYLLVGLSLLQYFPVERFPRIFAGTNLQSPLIRRFAHPVVDYESFGVCWVNRNPAAEDTGYGARLRAAVKQELESGRNFMTYPEQGRNLSGGEPFFGPTNQLGLLKLIFETDQDPYIVPVTTKYEHPIEERVRPLIEWGRKRHALTLPFWSPVRRIPLPQAISRAVYVGADMYGYASRYYSHGTDTGRGYFHINEPARLSDIVPQDHSRAKKQDALKHFYTTAIRESYARLGTEKIDT